MPFTPDQPCQNPSCKSFGHIHKNCRCFSDGGSVCAGEHASGCEHFADGGHIEANREFAENPDLAIDKAVANDGLLRTISRSGYSKSEEPGREHSEFLGSHHQGHKAVRSHVNSMLEPKHPRHAHDESRPESLQGKLDELRTNPDLALRIGGNLGDTLPAHHVALAAKTATAMNYLESIRPQPVQAGALDPVVPPSKLDERLYKRQLAIVENPRLFMQHVKDGTALPQDLQTLTSVYPKLREKIKDHAFQALADAKASGRKITHKEKRALSILIGEPLMFQQSPVAIAAILHANMPPQPAPATQKSPKKASAVELRQIDKTNELYKTPLEKLQTSRNR